MLRVLVHSTKETCRDCSATSTRDLVASRQKTPNSRPKENLNLNLNGDVIPPHRLKLTCLTPQHNPSVEGFHGELARHGVRQH